MIKKIIYIHETFFRKHRDMGIEVFKEKGYEVELWSNLRIKYKNTLTFPEDNIEDFVLYFDNHLQIIKQIVKQDWRHTICFFTTTAHRGGVEDFMRIAIGLAGGRYCNFIYEIIPVGYVAPTNKTNFVEAIKNVFNKGKYKIYRWLIDKYCGPTFCFVPTYYATQNLLTACEKKVAVEVHNKDYDEFLMNRSKEIVENREQYILFIDGDLVQAEDFRKSNMLAIYPRASLYYESINRVFDQLESFYHMPVYVAAHPKSEYKGNEFNGRKIIYYQTNGLVQNAKLVLTHASAAVNFIMLYKKPYIFLVDKYIRRHMVWKYLFLPQIRELKALQYRFDQGSEPWKYINWPSENYDLYSIKYIKHANFNGKLFYEIVEESIKTISIE